MFSISHSNQNPIQLRHVLIIFLFLLHAQSALVAILTIPVAVLLAFIPMYYQGLTANIMSLGGIAVAIGAMVDASIIIIENIHKKLGEWAAQGQRGKRLEAIIAGMQEVGPTIFFSLLVITVSFMPVFTLEATEGRLFKPLAFTKTYSMGFAAILAVTLTPALAALFVRGKILREEKNPLNRFVVWLYTPVVRFVVRYRFAVVAPLRYHCRRLGGAIWGIPAKMGGRNVQEGNVGFSGISDCDARWKHGLCRNPDGVPISQRADYQFARRSNSLQTLQSEPDGSELANRRYTEVHFRYGFAE